MRIAEQAKRAGYVAGLPVVVVTIWWVTSSDSSSFFWPSLASILRTLPETWLQGRLTSDVLPSVIRLIVGYLSAVIIGIILGTVIGSFRLLRLIAEPVLEYIRAIPPPVLIPIVILFLGIGDSMKVAVIIFGAVWPVLLNTVEGVRSVDEILRDTARCYRLRPSTRVRKLILRGASPQIMIGARVSLSVAIVLTVISEMFASSSGLGFTIIQFQRTFAIPEMWSGILILGLIGVALSLLFHVVEQRVLAWYFGQRSTQRGDG